MTIGGTSIDKHTVDALRLGRFLILTKMLAGLVVGQNCKWLYLRPEHEPALLAVTPAGADDVSGVVDVTRFR